MDNKDVIDILNALKNQYSLNKDICEALNLAIFSLDVQSNLLEDRKRLAMYELNCCDNFCFGDYSTGIYKCEWLNENDHCILKEWCKQK